MAELATDRGRIRARRCVCLALASSLCARPVAAEGGEAAGPIRADPSSADTGLPRELFWVSASAALVSASLGGLFGLRAIATYDRARELPGVDPQRFGLRDEIARHERTADYLFAGAALLAATSVVLALFTDWEGTAHAESRTADGARLRLCPAAGRGGAGLSLRGELF